MGMWEDVEAFNKKFNLPQTAIPSLPDAGILEFRLEFLKQELAEYEEAVKEGDVTKAFRELIDIVYVALGTGVMFNVPWPQGWRAVHEANMRKEVNKARNRNTGKHELFVSKPDGWVGPEKKLLALLLSYSHHLELAQATHRGKYTTKQRFAEEEDDEFGEED